jgi:hypothetical protein
MKFNSPFSSYLFRHCAKRSKVLLHQDNSKTPVVARCWTTLLSKIHLSVQFMCSLNINRSCGKRALGLPKLELCTSSTGMISVVAKAKRKTPGGTGYAFIAMGNIISMELIDSIQPLSSFLEWKSTFIQISNSRLESWFLSSFMTRRPGMVTVTRMMTPDLINVSK